MFNPNIGIVFDSLEIYTNKSSVLQVLPTSLDCCPVLVFNTQLRLDLDFNKFSKL